MEKKSLNPESSHKSGIRTWLNIALILITFGFVQMWVLTFYYQTQTNEWISWIANDGNDGPPFAFGQHYFGDYLTMHNVALSRDIRSFDNSYPPLGVIPFWLLSWLPYRIGFFVWVALLSSSILFPLAYSLYKTNREYLIQGVICFGILSVPFISVIDRGNSVGFLTFFFFMFYLFYKKEKPQQAALFLGLAVGLKVYPLVLLPFLVVRKKYKIAFFAFFYSIVFNILAICIWHRGDPFKGLKYSFNRIVDVEQLFINGHGMFLSVAQVLTNVLNRFSLESSTMGSFLIENYRIVSALTFIYLLFGAYLAKESDWIFLMLCAIQMIPTISFSYYRVWTIAVLAIMFMELSKKMEDKKLSKIQSIWLTVCLLNLTPLVLLNFWPINLFPTLVVLLILTVPLIEIVERFKEKSRLLRS